MDNTRMEDAKRIVKEIEDSNDLNKVEDMIKDNKISFEHKEKKYQIHLLSSKEKDELDSLRRKKINSMLQEKDELGNYVYLTEKALIKILKERGDIDIDKIDEDIQKIEAEELDNELKLGEAISKNNGEIILKTYKEKIEEFRLRRNILNTQKTLVLGFSLENQLLGYVAKVITYLSLDEMAKDNTWQRKFNTLEEFEQCIDNELIEKASTYAMLLQYI